MLAPALVPTSCWVVQGGYRQGGRGCIRANHYLGGDEHLCPEYLVDLVQEVLLGERLQDERGGARRPPNTRADHRGMPRDEEEAQRPLPAELFGEGEAAHER